MRGFKNIIPSKNEEINELNNKIDALQENFSIQLESLKTENNELKEELNVFKKDNDELKKELNVFKESNNELEKELNSFKKDNDELKKELNIFKKENNKILNSYNENFKLLFYYYDLKPKSLLKNMQDVCFEVLNFVVNICNKHGIEYWLEGGTLLGAVRHEGFLPWDDDIDLGMMRKDYELFMDVFDSEIKNCGLEKQVKWKLLRHKNNVLYFVQISYAGFAVLDIFPYDYIENPPENIKDLYDTEKSKFKSNILDGKTYSQAIGEIYENLNLSRDEKPFVIPGVERPGPSPFHVQKTEELFPLTKVIFNNNKYFGHKNNDYHLQKLYGDWKGLPKVLDRHNRIYKLRYRPNVNKNMEKKVIALRKINSSFND